MASNLVNVNLCYIEIELCIAQLGTRVRRLGTQVRGNILAVSMSGAALPYSAVWDTSKSARRRSSLRIANFAIWPCWSNFRAWHEVSKPGMDLLAGQMGVQFLSC